MDLSLVECLKLSEKNNDIFKKLKAKDHSTEIKRLLCSYHTIQCAINYIHSECKKNGTEGLTGVIELDYLEKGFGVTGRVYTLDYIRNKELDIVIYNQLLKSSCANLIVSSPEELGTVKLFIPPKDDILIFTEADPPNVINRILSPDNKKIYESAIFNISLNELLEKNNKTTKKMKV